MWLDNKSNLHVWTGVQNDLNRFSTLIDGASKYAWIIITIGLDERGAIHRAYSICHKKKILPFDFDEQSTTPFR